MKNKAPIVKNNAETATVSRAEFEVLQAKFEKLQQSYDNLLEQFALAQKQRFGQSSEQSKFDDPLCEQLSFVFNEAEGFANENVPEPELQKIESHYRHKKSKDLPDRLPEDLPVETEEYRLSPEERICEQCGEVMEEIGKKVTRYLKLIPARAVIVEKVVYTYACQSCKENEISVPVKQAEAPKPVIAGSFATPESVAHLMTQKFVMGSPIYRQEQEWKRHGVELSRQTMSNWMLKATEDWLVPVYDALHKQLCTHEVLHADETTLQVLKQKDKAPQSKSYMWLYRTSGDAVHPIVLYDYQPNRKATNPERFLAEFKGYLHTDGYAGYHKLPEQITVVGCWAHMRRKFDEALKAMPQELRRGSNAARGKAYCDKLFKIEEKAEEVAQKQAQPFGAAERYAFRQKDSKKLIDEFCEWIDSLHVSEKSAMGRACYYARSQKVWLENILVDGRLELSNNRAERSIKPFVIDRKNFLFCNTSRGATDSAVMFSLIETAKEMNLDPYAYLTEVFKRAPNLDLEKYPERVVELLPSTINEREKHSEEKCD